MTRTVSAPDGFTIEGVFYDVDDPAGSAPSSYTFQNLNLVGDQIDIVLHRNDAWVFVSEITFDTTNVPEPSGAVLMLAALMLLRRRA